ncbi:MAG: hypothetical protein HIU91_08575 [Acidobacteria bacterium]|nr:hypothetical protein [Acidobacteriota bacterium]
MKNLLSIMFQLILFVLTFFIGTILAGINVLPTLSVVISPGRVFVYDGMLLMFGLYAFVVVIGAMRKRLRIGLINTTVAFALALAVGLAMKFGFKSV